MASSTPLLEPTKLRSCASVEVRKLVMGPGVAVVAQFGAAAKVQGKEKGVASPVAQGRVWDESLLMGEEDGDGGGVDEEDARGYCGGREGDGYR